MTSLVITDTVKNEKHKIFKLQYEVFNEETLTDSQMIKDHNYLFNKNIHG